MSRARSIARACVSVWALALLAPGFLTSQPPVGPWDYVPPLVAGHRCPLSVNYTPVTYGCHAKGTMIDLARQAVSLHF